MSDFLESLLSGYTVFILIVLLSTAVTTASNNNTGEEQPETSIYELISMTEQLSIFHELIETAGMTDLFHEEELTLFLPVNDAFNIISYESLDAYREDPEGLQNLLNYHVIEGKILSMDLEDGQELEMRNGETAQITLSGAGIEFNESNVIQVDVETSNGVIHVINQVNIPE